MRHIPTMLLLCLLVPATAVALPTSYEFSGQLFAGGDAITASWTVDPEAAPLAVNWNHWTGNALYPVESTIQIGSTSGSFDHYCVGYCIFSSGNLEVLRMTSGNLQFQLTFTPGFDTWIENGSWLKIFRDDGGYSWWFFEGTPSFHTVTNTPEAESVWYLMLGLVGWTVGMYAYAYGRDRWA